MSNTQSCKIKSISQNVIYSGVARTQPQVLAFPDEAEGASWYLQSANSPPWNTTPDALPRMYAASKVLNGVVDARVGNAAAHVGATLVARDMLSIMQALGREKLQFWGISYVTSWIATSPANVELQQLRYYFGHNVSPIQFEIGRPPTSLC